jgi:hypothetical protein
MDRAPGDKQAFRPHVKLKHSQDFNLADIPATKRTRPKLSPSARTSYLWIFKLTQLQIRYLGGDRSNTFAGLQRQPRSSHSVQMEIDGFGHDLPSSAIGPIELPVSERAEWISRGKRSRQVSSRSSPSQPSNLVRSLLNLATGDFFSSAVASLLRAPTSRRESIRDMTNRICGRYFPERRPAIKE